MTDAELVALLLTEARAKFAVDTELDTDTPHNAAYDAAFADWMAARRELRAAVLGRLEAERGPE